MPTMNATRTLRDAPFGEDLGIQAKAGTKVTILDVTNPLWLKIELLEVGDPRPSGWVNAQSVNRNDASPSALDKAIFASECVFQAMTFRVMAHYLMAVAHMRTDIVDGDHGANFGPFALSKEEWTAFAMSEEFGLGMGEDLYRSWTAQCMVFAVMANWIQRKISALLANEPTAAELALAQMIGPTAAIEVLRDPGKAVLDVVASIDPDDLKVAGINADTLPVRHKDFVVGKTGREALDLVSSRLQISLDETATFVTAAGAGFIEFADELASADTSASDFTSAEVTGTKTVRYTAKDSTTLVKKNGSIAWRQNNPGNISNGPFAESQGAIGKGDRFAIFASEQKGFDAIVALLTGPTYRDLSLEAAITKYAPPQENDTAAYIAFLTAQTGISKSEILRELLNSQIKALAKGIQKHEGWIVGSEIRTGVNQPSAGGVTADMIIRAALNEWDHWGGSTHNLVNNTKAIAKVERDPSYAEYVYDTYYKATVKNPDPGAREGMITRIKEQARPTYAWSACTISYIMKTAGYTKEQFKFSQSHSVYIRNAVAAKKNDSRDACFWGYRIHEISPDVGDLIGYARQDGLDFAGAQAWYDKTGSYDSHTDVVVATRPGEIDVIGGNVSDSVTKKTLATDAAGKLADRSFPWFVVMKRRMPT